MDPAALRRVRRAALGARAAAVLLRLRGGDRPADRRVRALRPGGHRPGGSAGAHPSQPAAGGAEQDVLRHHPGRHPPSSNAATAQSILEDVNKTMKLIRYADGEYLLDVEEIDRARAAADGHPAGIPRRLRRPDPAVTELVSDPSRRDRLEPRVALAGPDGCPAEPRPGWARPQAAAERLRGTKVEAIYTSDLQRARQTAEAVAAATGAERAPGPTSSGDPPGRRGKG